MFAFLSTLFCVKKSDDLAIKSTDPYKMLDEKLNASGIRSFRIAHCGTVSVDRVELSQSRAYTDYIASAKAIVENS